MNGNDVFEKEKLVILIHLIFWDDSSPQCMIMYDYFLFSTVELPPFRSSSSNSEWGKEETHSF